MESNVILSSNCFALENTVIHKTLCLNVCLFFYMINKLIFKFVLIVISNTINMD